MQSVFGLNVETQEKALNTDTVYLPALTFSHKRRSLEDIWTGMLPIEVLHIMHYINLLTYFHKPDKSYCYIRVCSSLSNLVRKIHSTVVSLCCETVI